MAPEIGCLPWVSAVLNCSLRGVSLLMKAQVTMLVPGATVDHADKTWHPETARFPLKHVALKLVDWQAGTWS